MIHTTQHRVSLHSPNHHVRPRPTERGVVDLEVVLMLGFVVSAVLLTMLFIGGFAEDVPTVAAGQVDQAASPGQPAPARDASTAPRGDVFDEFRRGVAAVLDTSSAAPTVEERVEAPPAGLTLLSPTEGETVYGDSFTLRFVAGGIQLGGAGETSDSAVASLPSALVRVTLDEGEPILLERAQPYTFNNVAEGNHLLTVELVDERLVALRPAVTEWVRFRVENAPPPEFLPITGE